MVSAPYPRTFYIAHMLFEGAPFREGGEWGEITDGPADWSDLREAIVCHFRAEPPTLANLRIWHFQPDVPARDVTEDVIAVLSGRWAEAA